MGDGPSARPRRGLDAPTFGLAYGLLFAVRGVESFLRRLDALRAGGRTAAAALRAGGAVLVYPGGNREACRPWTERNHVDFRGRKGFVRLALRTGVPVVPVVAHGSHHSVVVLSRGDRVARALGLDRVKIHCRGSWASRSASRRCFPRCPYPPR